MLASCVLTASRTDRGFSISSLFCPHARPLFPPHEATLADALRTLMPLSPSPALCLLFLSWTRFTESISASKYPRGYAVYRAHVAMFVPVLAPVWARNVLAVRVALIELKRVARLSAVAHALI
ncbi:hypothetical protein BC826DRAFT_999537, partial [Russula brevipes]